MRVYVRETTELVTERIGASISIIDTGVGFSLDDAKRLFEPFFSTKSTKGTGLGLWISKGIVQKYDGQISYRSYRFKGRSVTCFRIFFPGSEIYEISRNSVGGTKKLKNDAGAISNGATPQSESGISSFVTGQTSTVAV